MFSYFIYQWITPYFIYGKFIPRYRGQTEARMKISPFLPKNQSIKNPKIRKISPKKARDLSVDFWKSRVSIIAYQNLRRIGGVWAPYGVQGQEIFRFSCTWTPRKRISGTQNFFEGPERTKIRIYGRNREIS